MDLEGKVIRKCDHCNSIYIDDNKGLERIKECKFCGLSTGFFESFRHFYRNIDLYGTDTEYIKTPELKAKVLKDYGLTS